jgi:hypothetical protein
MPAVWTWLAGKKTYIVAGVTCLYALAQWWGGNFDAHQAQQMIETAVLGATIRHGIG